MYFTISHVVQISGQVPEDRLKADKCWTLNIILFHNSGLPYLHMMIDEDYKNVGVFVFESQGIEESTRDQSILLHTDEYLQLFPPYSLPLCNIWRYLNNRKATGKNVP